MLDEDANHLKKGIQMVSNQGIKIWWNG